MPPTLRRLAPTTPEEDAASAALTRQAEAVLAEGQARSRAVEAQVRGGSVPPGATCYESHRVAGGHPGFLAALDDVRAMHMRKCLDYGTDADPLSNIRESAAVLNVPSWSGAILRAYDKIHRIKAYFCRGRVEYDGIEDTLLDGCSYFAIALALYREESGRQVLATSAPVAAEPSNGPPRGSKEHIDAIRRRAQRYAGPFTPSSSAMANDVLFLCDEIDRLRSPSGCGLDPVAYHRARAEQMSTNAG